MLYSTKAESKQPGPRTVWIWFALAITGLLITWLAYVVIWPDDYPPKSDLVKVGGAVRKVMILDDISGGGAIFPVFSSAYFHFKEDDNAYRYRWMFANYYYVREYANFNVDIWVNKNDLGKNDGEPILIWALEEKNKFKSAEEQIVVQYEENTKQLDANAASVLKVAKWMGGGAFFLLIGGFWNIRWNRRNYPGL